ncbi:MAG: hypothetical protein ACPKNR_09350 [Pleomorphochaeta sp.]
MKKRLILITTILAIVSGALFAADQVVANTATAYAPTAFSVDNTGDSATVVADADNVEFVFALEAQNGANWVSAESQEVYDADWNVRNAQAVTVDFRVRATAGTADTANSVQVTVGAGKLTRVLGSGESGSAYVVDKDVVIAAPSVAGTTYFTNLVGSAVTAATGTATASSPITFKTVANHFYGLTANAAGDSVNFNITYTGDANAPAGRYESAVTVAYAAL